MTSKNFRMIAAGAIALASSFGIASATVAPITNGGDFSDDNLNPTEIGTFSDDFAVAGTVVNALNVDGLPPADVDVFTFTIEDGFFLSGITLSGFDSTDDLGFLALNTGTSFPFDAEGLGNSPDTSLFTAGLLFGAGTPDILSALIASGIGSGILEPLTGDITLYVQQLGGAFIDYELSFQISEVPLPPAALLFGAGLVGFAGVRRKRAQNA